MFGGELEHCICGHFVWCKLCGCMHGSSGAVDCVEELCGSEHFFVLILVCKCMCVWRKTDNYVECDLVALCGFVYWVLI